MLLAAAVANVAAAAVEEVELFEFEFMVLVIVTKPSSEFRLAPETLVLTVTKLVVFEEFSAASDKLLS